MVLSGTAIASVVGWLRVDSLAVGMLVSASPLQRTAATPPDDVRERLDVETEGARVRAWLLEPHAAVRGTIVILHGIRDSKLASLDSARRHVRHGYRVVIWDSRGHGESTGRYLTYGVQEARDLRALVDRLEQRGWLAQPLYVIGTSYGAATALQYGALDSRASKIVAIAPFASLREVVPPYLSWMLGGMARRIPPSWVNARIDDAGRLAGFDPDLACPRCVAPKIRSETLVIASRADERIPYQQAQAIVDALGPRGTLMLVEGVGHVDVGNAPGVADAIARWLDAR